MLRSIKTRLMCIIAAAAVKDGKIKTTFVQ